MYILFNVNGRLQQKNTTTTLKRRRPHTLNDDSLGSFHHGDHYYPSTVGRLLNEHERLVLDQAASILQVPTEELLCLSPAHYNSYIIERAAHILGTSSSDLVESSYASRSQSKRVRHSIDYHPVLNMPPKYRYCYPYFDQEKTVLPGPFATPERAETDRRSYFSLPLTDGSSFIASTASGLADCLASLSSCQPSAAQDGSIGKFSATALLYKTLHKASVEC